jgi:site-specific recombinase XerD
VRALERANVKRFAPYSIRHTALTNLAPECDTFALKTIAGHSSITITQRYVHPQAQAITNAFEKMTDRQNVVIAGGHSEELTDQPLQTEEAASVR